MIGPHEGRELEMMLAGEKPFAVFHDLVVAGASIPEEIIPEAAFAPHVDPGGILRFAEDITVVRTNEVIRYVCFTVPGEAWRAQFLLWLKREFHGGRLDHDPEHDVIIGRLLGYGDADIRDYIAQNT